MTVRWRDTIDVEVVWDDEEKAYRATVADIPDGAGFGPTPEAADGDFEPVLAEWFEMFAALREAVDVAPVLKAVVRSFLERTNAPRYNEVLEEVFGAFAVGEHPQTREMRFFLEHLESFTPAFFTLLQTDVVNRFPRWSVVPQYNEAVVEIHADGFVFDGRTRVRGPVTDAHPAYVAWDRRAHELRERRSGPRWRQLQYLGDTLPGRLAELGTARAVHLATFDVEGAAHRFAVWVLVRDEDDYGLGSDVAATRFSRVTPEGVILPTEDAPRPPSAGPFVATFVLDALPASPVTLFGGSNDPVEVLDLSPPVRDRDLKELFGTLA